MILGLKKKDRMQYLGFDDAKFMLIGIPLLGALIPLIFFFRNIDEIEFTKYGLMVTESTINGLVYWIAIRTFAINLRKSFPDFTDTGFRIVRELVFVIVMGVLLGGLVNLFCRKILMLPVSGNAYKGFIATYFSSFFILTIYEAMYLYNQNRNSLIAQENQKREHIKSELQGLRNQINPHFLFNSMNTLMNIIPEDPDLATSFLKKLSSVYRYILQSREEYVIPLSQELEFIKSYVFLQKERFKNNLEVSFEIKDDLLDLLILPLSLQLLLENAIKHNVVSSKYPLKIKITGFADSLIIENSLKLRPQNMPSTGVGLKNIEKRYQFISDRKLTVDKSETKFKVSLPLLKQEELTYNNEITNN